METSSSGILPQNATKSVAKPQLSDILRNAGAGFGLVPRGGKHPLEHGWKTQPVGFDVAARHLANGGNVGVITGDPSGGIVSIDADVRWPEFLATFPELQRTLTATRANAPERGKLLLRVTDQTPPNRKWYRSPPGTQRTPDDRPLIELLSTGLGAIIAGVHKSGAPINLAGECIVEVTFDELNVIWRKWTAILGREDDLSVDHSVKKNRIDPNTERRVVDAEHASFKERVAAAWTAFDVFRHHGWASEVTKEGGDLRLHDHGGLLVGNPHGDQPWRWYSHGDERGGDSFDAWAFCTGRICDSHSFPIILDEMAEAAGIPRPEPQPPPMTPDVGAQISAWRNLVHDVNWSSMLDSTRRGNAVISFLDAALDFATERATLHPIVSLRQLALRAGKASAQTAENALALLADLGAVTVTCDGVTQLHLVDPGGFALRLDRKHFRGNTVQCERETPHALFSMNKADDPWLTGTSRWAKKNLDRPPADDDPKVLRDWLLETAGFGATSLRIVDLLDSGDEMTVGDVAGALHYKNVGSVRRHCAHLADMGVLDVDQEKRDNGRPANVYALSPDWRMAVENARPTLRTHKLGAERSARAERDVIEYIDEREELERSGIVPPPDPIFEAKRRNRKLRASAALAGYLQVIDPTLSAEEAAYLASQPSKRRQMIRERAAAEKLRQAGVDLAATRHAAEWETTENLRKSVEQLKNQGVPQGDWYRHLRTAGYTESEAGRAVKGFGMRQ